MPGGGFRRRDKKSTNRPLAVVEARQELDAERRADGDERADEVDRERERRAVVRDVLGQAVPVVLAAPADGQAADGAARAEEGLDDRRRGARRRLEPDRDAQQPAGHLRHPDAPHGREEDRVTIWCF